MAAAKSTPKDALVMNAILKDMGVTNYEPRVINQMLEFVYRHITGILDDARVYSQYAKRKNIDFEDLRLAIQMKTEFAFTSPPPRDLLVELARQKNCQPLPAIKPHTGLRLPPDRYCLISANYRHKSLKKPSRLQASMPNMSPRLTLSSQPNLSANRNVKTVSQATNEVSKLPGSLSLVTKSMASPTVTIVRPVSGGVTAKPSTPVNRFTPGPSLVPPASTPTPSQSASTIATIVTNAMKRKRDDDDYDNP